MFAHFYRLLCVSRTNLPLIGNPLMLRVLVALVGVLASVLFSEPTVLTAKVAHSNKQLLVLGVLLFDAHKVLSNHRLSSSSARRLLGLDLVPFAHHATMLVAALVLLHLNGTLLQAHTLLVLLAAAARFVGTYAYMQESEF